MTTKLAKWSTPNRQANLIQLFLKSQGFCLFGYKPCRGNWQVTTRTLCYYGTPCNSHNVDKPCRFKYLAEADTPIRQCKTLVVTLKHWHCAYNSNIACYKPYDCHYIAIEDYQIKEWVADDKSEAMRIWYREQRTLHDLGEQREPIRGRFNNIGRDIFAGNQPVYYLEGLGISGVTLKPFAKVKLASSYLRLYVDLGNNLRGISKHKRRKAIRYGKELPLEVESKVAELVKLAVRDYLNH